MKTCFSADVEANTTEMLTSSSLLLGNDEWILHMFAEWTYYMILLESLGFVFLFSKAPTENANLQ